MQIAKIKLIRFTNSLGSRSRVTVNILREMNLLNVETSIKQLRLNHVYNIFCDLCSTYLKENFVPLKEVYQYNTRSSCYSLLVSYCQSLDKSTFS